MALPERIVVSLLLHGSGALGCLNYGNNKEYIEDDFKYLKERRHNYIEVQ